MNARAYHDLLRAMDPVAPAPSTRRDDKAKADLLARIDALVSGSEVDRLASRIEAIVGGDVTVTPVSPGGASEEAVELAGKIENLIEGISADLRKRAAIEARSEYRNAERRQRSIDPSAPPAEREKQRNACALDKLNALCRLQQALGQPASAACKRGA